MRKRHTSASFPKEPTGLLANDSQSRQSQVIRDWRIYYDELSFASATELAEKVQNKEISAVELLNHYLDRVDRFNGDLNAVVVDTREQALADAKAADADLAKGVSRGPLHGVPMTVKESFHIAGTASTWGNPALKDNVFDEMRKRSSDSRAPAPMAGKTNIPISLELFQILARRLRHNQQSRSQSWPRRLSGGSPWQPQA